MIVRSGNYPEEAFVSEAPAFPAWLFASAEMRCLLNTNPQSIQSGGAGVAISLHP